MKYYILSTITRLLLGKLRKYHKKEDQLLVFSRDFIGEEVFAFGVYEKNEIDTIISSLDFDLSQANAVDVGANIGNHSLQFAKHFNKVFSFEPNKVIFDVLKINTRKCENVHLFNFGLSDSEIKAYLDIPEFNFGGASVSTSVSKGKSKILLKKFDNEIDQDIALVKIDVEGHELNVLRGMIKTIEKNRPILCFELINTDESATKLIDGLKDMGYHRFYKIRKRGIFRNSRSFIGSFINRLLYRPRPELEEIRKFDAKMYNLIICEREDSVYRIKKEKAKSSKRTKKW